MKASVTRCSDSYFQKPQNQITVNKFPAGWYLIYTRPQHEKKVYAGLTEININSFLPLTKRLKVWHDRKKYVNEPLFPSYVFVYLNNFQNYYDGLHLEGALYYVRTGKVVARVSEAVVENVRLVTNKASELEVSYNHFQVGEKVVISKGALTGLSCEIVRVQNKNKLLVRIELLQRNVLLELPEDCVMPS